MGPELPDDYRLADGWDNLPQFYDTCAYEEFLIDEIAEADSDAYLPQISIQIE